MRRRLEPGADARPVRVLTVLPADPERLRIGGIASFVRGFVKFAPDDFELGFIGLSASRPAWRWETIVLEGRSIRFLPVAMLPSLERSRMPLALRFTAALLAHRRQLAAQGWITAFHRPASDVAFRGHGPMWRVVHLSVEDLTSEGSESRWRPLARPLAAAERRSFKRMAHIYVVNERAAERYRARFPDVAERISFLPNWADPTIFMPAADGERDRLRSAMRVELGLPRDSRVLLAAGRLEGQKDPLLLARAFAALRADDADLRLLIAGEGTLEDRMRRELGALGALDAVRFVGTVPRERLAELMQASDLLVITSGFETGPTVGLEALASGLPVVTTRVGEVAGLVERGAAGVVAEDRSLEAVVAALRSALDAGPHRLRAAAHAAAAPYLADRILGALYDDNRALAALL